MPTIKAKGGIKLTAGSVSMPFVNIPPTWETDAGSLGSVTENNTISSGEFAIAAVDADGLPVSPVVYDIVDDPQNLFPPATLNPTSGVISGPTIEVASDTIHNFTARVSDGQDQATRDFSITVTNIPTATVAFQTSAVDPVDRTVYTFSTQAIGTAASDRKVVVCVTGIQGNNTGEVSSMTIGGVSASLVVAQGSVVELAQRIEIWQAAVPTGTTADVVVTWNANTARCGIGVYAVFGATAGAHATDGDNADPMIMSINVPANGIVIGGAYSSDTTSYAWTGITENYDDNIEAGGFQSGASDEFATLQTGLAIIADPFTSGGQPARRAAAVASWGPA